MKQLADRFNVSRETIEKLIIYRDLLVKWNPKINLVSSKTLPDSIGRHFADSLQLWAYRGTAKSWADLGSGGGFPGMVVAIANSCSGNSLTVTLVEADARKCSFLRTVSRETNTPVEILANRIEEANIEQADIVSARALAPLTKLLEMTHGNLSPAGFALYLKGQSCDEEIAAASRAWSFSYEKFPSKTDADAAVLKVWDIERVSG